MRAVGGFEAKTHFSQLVDEMNQTGEPVIVQNRGKSVAILQALDSLAKEDRQRRSARLLEAFAEIRQSQEDSPGEPPDSCRLLGLCRMVSPG